MLFDKVLNHFVHFVWYVGVVPSYGGPLVVAPLDRAFVVVPHGIGIVLDGIGIVLDGIGIVLDELDDLGGEVDIGIMPFDKVLSHSGCFVAVVPLDGQVPPTVEIDRVFVVVLGPYLTHITHANVFQMQCVSD